MKTFGVHFNTDTDMVPENTKLIIVHIVIQFEIHKVKLAKTISSDYDKKYYSKVKR